MALSHRFLKFVRSLHLYLGVFTAPALMFFAITGGLQTFSLHETTRGSDYKPPAWLASAAQLHKKQTVVMPERRARPGEGSGKPSEERSNAVPVLASASASNASDTNRAAANTASDRPVEGAASRPKQNLLPMKIFFGFIALSLLLSTLTGLYMAWKFSRRPKVFGAVFAAGIVVPLLLSLF
jgi:hypothetical protein